MREEWQARPNSGSPHFDGREAQTALFACQTVMTTAPARCFHYYRQRIHTSTMHNSLLEPASHGADSMTDMLPSALNDWIVSRKVCMGATDGNPRITMNAEKGAETVRASDLAGLLCEAVTAWPHRTAVCAQFTIP